MYKYRCCLVALTIFFLAAETSAQSNGECGALAEFATDYRSATANQKYIVENAHFNRQIEALQQGSSATVGDDLHFTLRTFPNHHRALMSMMNLSFKQKRDRPNGAVYTVECWFDRAIRFRPDDETVRMIHGIYLMKRGQLDSAVKEFEEARKGMGENANLSYNLGLAYFDLRDYERSLALAHEAYRLGFPLEGLRRKLVAAGRWSEPVPVVTPAVSEASAQQTEQTESVKSESVDKAIAGDGK